jgi:ketosteroid isomerase-like protein
MVIENGKITVMREYLDSAHVAQVFCSFAPANA